MRNTTNWFFPLSLIESPFIRLHSIRAQRLEGTDRARLLQRPRTTGAAARADRGLRPPRQFHLRHRRRRHRHSGTLLVRPCLQGADPLRSRIPAVRRQIAGRRLQRPSGCACPKLTLRACLARFLMRSFSKGLLYFY